MHKVFFSLAFICQAFLAAGALAQAQRVGPDDGAKDNVQDMVAAHLKTCPARYARIIKRVDEADTADASFYSVPDYPWIRGNRFLASYVGHFENELELTTWLSQLRDNEGYARNIELRNAGLSDAERRETLDNLRVCAVWLSIDRVFNPDTEEAFIDATLEGARVKAADHAPISARQQKKIAQDIDRRFNSQPEKTPVTEWRVARPEGMMSPSEVFALYRDLPRDALGRIGMFHTAWNALAHHYAPVWLIHTQTQADVPGAPTIDAAGNTRINRETPTVYWHITYTRVESRAVPQINYVVFFGDDAGQPENGQVWRITLNQQGQPVVYESMRLDGTEHLWFPATAMRVREDVDPTVPQSVAGTGIAATRMLSDTHQVYRVATQATYEAADYRRYTLAPYDDLLTLETGPNRSASLFDAKGRLKGAKRTGQRNPPMRQLGSHSLAPGEPFFFDDPNLFDANFALLEPASDANMTDTSASR
ncbi:MAG: hypothetical protein CMN28_14450 [Salinisphaeraceae bacterium]|nr:hypothetical protein [Salinisphaeraceae bacterium]